MTIEPLTTSYNDLAQALQAIPRAREGYSRIPNERATINDGIVHVIMMIPKAKARLLFLLFISC